MNKKGSNHEISITSTELREANEALLNSNEVGISKAGEIIKIELSNVKTLNEYLHYKKNLMDYDKVCKLVKDLIFIQTTLESSHKSILYYSFKDIIVINDDVFLFINSSKIIDIKDGKIRVNFPIKKSMTFLFPEITSASKLPIVFHYKSTYYSLGLLTIKLLVPEKKEIELTDQLENILYPTKLFWFLKEVFSGSPHNRNLVLL
jgi:hypothetical protein